MDFEAPSLCFDVCEDAQFRKTQKDRWILALPKPPGMIFFPCPRLVFVLQENEAQKHPREEEQS